MPPLTAAQQQEHDAANDRAARKIVDLLAASLALTPEGRRRLAELQAEADRLAR